MNHLLRWDWGQVCRVLPGPLFVPLGNFRFGGNLDFSIWIKDTQPMLAISLDSSVLMFSESLKINANTNKSLPAQSLQSGPEDWEAAQGMKESALTEVIVWKLRMGVGNCLQVPPGILWRLSMPCFTESKRWSMYREAKVVKASNSEYLITLEKKVYMQIYVNK